MSRARRANKRRILVAALASATVISGIAATAALAGQSGGTGAAEQAACTTAGGESAKPSSWVAFPQVAEVLTVAGAKQDTLQRLETALGALPADDVGVKVDGVGGTGGAAPKAAITSLDQQSPKAYASASPEVTLADIDRSVAAVNKSLADVWTETDGRDGIQTALVKKAVSSALNINIDDLDVDDLDVGNLKINAGGLEIELDDLEIDNLDIDEIDLQVQKDSAEPVKFALKSVGDCGAAAGAAK